MSHATLKKIVTFRIQDTSRRRGREDFRSAESVDAKNGSRDISRRHYVSYTRAYRRAGVMAAIVYVRTASCQVPSRTTNNRKCSHNNADMRRCSRMRARAFAYTRGTRTTQISSAITQNANRARKRGPTPSFRTLPPTSVSSVSLWKSKRPVAHTTAHTNFTKWRVHRKDYLCGARVSDVGGGIDRVRLRRGLLGLQIKELDRALSKNANCAHVAGRV